MKKYVVETFGLLPVGLKVRLTREQCLSRLHLLPRDIVKKLEDGKAKSVTFITTGRMGFKYGEEVNIEGELDRGLEIMFGVEPGRKTAPIGAVSPDQEPGPPSGPPQTNIDPDDDEGGEQVE